MAQNYLNKTGLSYFFDRLKTIFAPISHASSSDTYGKGTSSNYGHVMLSDATNGTSAAAGGGTAATPKAVADALAAATGAIPSPADATPLMDGTAAVGTSTDYAREDHRHPTDTSRAPTSHASSATTYGAGTSSNYGHVKLSDATNGTAAAASGGTAATPKAVADALAAATGAIPSPADTAPLMDGVAAVGTSTDYAREDHVHPSDTTKADKSATVSDVTYDTTNKKITKTINGTTTDVVSAATLKTDMNFTKSDIGLSNVDNTADANKSVASAAALTTARNIDGIAFDGSSSITHFATCETASGTAAKLVTIADETFTLEAGASVLVQFDHYNSASNPTLNVNMTGAKAIKTRGNRTPGTLARQSWSDNQVIHFVYTGTEWRMVDFSEEFSYENARDGGQGYATCSTSSGTALTASLSNYTGENGGIVSVRFTNAVPANATLNINSSGAKSITYKNAAITAGVIKAGDTATFILDANQSTHYYRLISIDRGAVEEIAPSDTAPAMDGTASAGASSNYSRGDHVHPTDTSRAPLASPALTGTPTAPTATAGTSSTQIATTAFVQSAIQAAAVGAATFKGTVNTNTDISGLSDYKSGWYWVVATAGTYVGETCEVGDMIFCVSDRSSAYSADDFSVVQNNLDLVAITTAEIDTIVGS